MTDDRARPSASAVDAAVVLELCPDAVLVLDDAWRCTYLNPVAGLLLARPRSECTGRTFWELYGEQLADADAAMLRRTMEDRGMCTLERPRAARGRWIELRAVALPTGGLVLYARDVSERHLAEETLAESERQLRTILESEPECVMLVERGAHILQINRAGLELLEVDSVDMVLGVPVVSFVAPEHRAAYVAAHEAALAGERRTLEFEIEGRRGTRRWLSTTSTALRDIRGEAFAVLSITRDITARKHAEHALRASEERYRLVTLATRDVVYDWDLRTNTLEMSDAVYEQFHYAPGTVRRELSWWEENVHPDDLSRVWQGLQRFVAERGEVWADEYRFRRGDGTWAVVAASGYLMRDAQGTPVRLIGTVRDLTLRKALEERLRQAQKLEAVGRLAGGIAHDFNNILTAILSSAELARGTVPEGSPAREDLDDIRRAIARGSTLTRQLLAFGRRQVMQPRILNLNEVVRGAERLLRRLISESIKLETSLEPELWPVRADPGQLEQALMNLAMNARDAMPAGGVLRIRTANRVVEEADARRGPAVLPGAYVCLEVRDSGVGMDVATRERLFEPFFTTKEMWRGVGLGLATVYGIVEQSGGTIDVDSTPGQGSTFDILLPRADLEAPNEVPHHDEPSAGHDGRTVLLAEDEDAVRSSVRRILERSGFHVLEARDGVEALEIWEREHGRIDLVLSDVVMPRLGGRELLARIRAMDPDARVLLMSGYTSNTEAVSELLAAGAALIEKPFAIDVLLSRINEMLASHK
ncbi:MAG TPA: PAS domain S-box protein [Gemmatimonadaceae bacterium]|nr:PAS domain S-box protein [Gemmatimonadaceae bacterium]